MVFTEVYGSVADGLPTWPSVNWPGFDMGKSLKEKVFLVRELSSSIHSFICSILIKLLYVPENALTIRNIEVKRILGFKG